MTRLDLAERTKLVKAMEYIVRQVNNECILDRWLMCGVADGDIEYGDFTPEDSVYTPAGDFADNDCAFSDLMELFLDIMTEAKRDGGLYCNGVSSEEA